MMKRVFVCLLLVSGLAIAADGDQDPLTLGERGAAVDVKAIQGRLDPAIAQLVTETHQAEPPPAPLRQDTPAYRSTHADIMTAAFDDAKVPDCLHSEGLKRQPTFLLSGVLALPFIAVAKLRGKCI